MEEASEEQGGCRKMKEWLFFFFSLIRVHIQSVPLYLSVESVFLTSPQRSGHTDCLDVPNRLCAQAVHFSH